MACSGELLTWWGKQGSWCLVLPPPQRPEKAEPGTGNWLQKLKAPWKKLVTEQHHHLAAQVLFIAGRHWQLLGTLLILQVCACALGCLYNWSKTLNLSLSVPDLTPTAVCWQMLTPNAWMGSLWSGHLLWSATPISCFKTDEISTSLLGAISIRWDDESHQAQLGNLHFRIHLRITNQQLFRLSQSQLARAPSHKNIHISHCLQRSPKKIYKTFHNGLIVTDLLLKCSRLKLHGMLSHNVCIWITPSFSSYQIWFYLLFLK